MEHNAAGHTSALRLLRPDAACRPGLRVAVVAPPWIAVPPAGYGGIEAVIDLLCEEFVARGHDVTLFAAPGTQSSAHVQPLLESAHPDTIGAALHESDHVSAAFDAIDEAGEAGRPFDVVHDHSGFTALAMAGRVDVPVVHTLHGAFVPETAAFYGRHGHKALLVAISRSQLEHAPPGLQVAAVVANPIAVHRWPFRSRKDDYLLWIGRMDPVKGAPEAIEAARLAGRSLVLAGPVQTGQADFFREHVEPHIDGRRVRYVGEVGGMRKQELYAGAAATLVPLRWEEPFGMVMVESLACGTPVIAFARGAATEIVIDGENGMLVADETEMAHAIDKLDSIDPVRCRESVRDRYDVATVTDGYEAVYRQATSRTPLPERMLKAHAQVSRLAGGSLTL
jgi:glycosyltransferase involved in cell wall biosynthesis